MGRAQFQPAGRLVSNQVITEESLEMMRAVDVIRRITRSNIAFPEIEDITRSMGIEAGLHPVDRIASRSIDIPDREIMPNDVSTRCSIVIRETVGYLL